MPNRLQVALVLAEPVAQMINREKLSQDDYHEIEAFVAGFGGELYVDGEQTFIVQGLAYPDAFRSEVQRFTAVLRASCEPLVVQSQAA